MKKRIVYLAGLALMAMDLGATTTVEPVKTAMTLPREITPINATPKVNNAIISRTNFKRLIFFITLYYN